MTIATCLTMVFTVRPNVEVTDAVRFYRTASMLIDGLDIERPRWKSRCMYKRQSNTPEASTCRWSKVD